MQDSFLPAEDKEKQDLSLLRRLGRQVPLLRRVKGRLRTISQSDQLVMACYQKIFERGRLKLPAIAPEKLVTDNITIELPALHPLFGGEDTPMIDLFFILGLAKSRAPRRILEVGTYRGKTTLALFCNCPDAQIVSYDVMKYDSNYRERLRDSKNVELRHADFAKSRAMLLQEEKFDFIYIDGAHDVQSVCEDSELAFEILAPNGVIIWHDYRYNGYATEHLRVPEALEVVKGGRQLFHVSRTTCAVYGPTIVA